MRSLNNESILIFGDGTQTRDFTYVEDTVNGLIESVNCDKVAGRTLNVGSSFEISVNQIAEMILRLSGMTVTNTKYLNNRLGDVLRLHADSTEFRKITDWHPKTSLEDGLLKTIQWFRKRPEGFKTLLSQEKGINWRHVGENQG